MGGGSGSYRAPWLHYSLGGVLVPSGLLPPTFRDWVIPAISGQTQSYCKSADVDEAGQPQRIRKIYFSFLVLVMLKNMKEGLCHSLTRLC